MADRRHKDKTWSVADEVGNLHSGIKDGVTLAVLMDIRDELKLLTAEMYFVNSTFRCHNFLAIPQTLRRISRNTAKPKRKKKA